MDTSQHLTLRTLNPTAYFQADFRLNNRVNEYERVVYSFFDMAGDIGGFGEAVYILCLAIVGGYANRMFFASVIQDTFKVRLETHGRQIKDLAKEKTLAKKRRRSTFVKSTIVEEPNTSARGAGFEHNNSARR